MCEAGGPSVGEKQPQADPGESIAAEPPDVIDLRGNGHAGHGDAVPANGSAAPEVAGDGAEPGGGRLTASESWQWVSLGQQISDLLHDTRRITGRVVVTQRTHVSGFDAPSAPEVVPHAPQVVEAEVEPVAEVTVAEPKVAEPEAEEAEPEVAEPEVAEPEVAVTEVAPEVVESETEPGAQPEAAPAQTTVEPEPVPMQRGGADSDPDRWLWRVGKPVVAILSVALVVAAVTAALSARHGDTTATPRPAAASKPALAPGAVNWLAENTAPGARVFVPPALVDDVAAGLQGRVVLAYGETTVDSGDLVAVQPGFVGLPAGSLTQEVLASTLIVGRLPGSEVDLRQVIGSDDSGVAARRTAGSELLKNPALSVSQDTAAELRNGRVDERVLVILAGITSQHSLDVVLPRDPADAPAAPLRTLLIRKWDGSPITSTAAGEIEDFVNTQVGPLAGPVVAQVGDAGTASVSVGYLLPASFDLLTSGSFPTTTEESP
jgi:hypothetical protein